ncbi:tetratricopeptide repeat protein [Flavobacterium cheniae]|uniref:Tetratricopeptide repeat protein n=1 Tax=Flavobacterium cheniae TaxID=295428 RepID=A0A562KSY8_9FLAO|nr:tetratricopeptide repeat protein [Flavobacterium cheniae]TDR25428.1 tetratricopeptide repeat protein [Flavobacterium cheniae]TWH98385.1 tetratricopeptide repeat protein [Flavobacterium cheniae]
MNKIQILLFTFYSLLSFGQNKSADEIKSLYENKQYDKIIDQYGSKAGDYSSDSYYQIGFAYYMKEDDNNSLKFMDLSIEKDPKKIAPYFIKGSTLNYMGKYEDAVKAFENALKINPNDPQSLSGLGDSYYNLKKNELALDSYKKAIEQENASERPYSMIAQIYSDLDNKDKALEAYYNVKLKVSKDSDSYINALFNIGLMESFKENYAKAEPVFLEIIELNPKDYHAYAKVIQTYYRQKNYDKAKPYRSKLYEAYQKGELTGDLKDMFCFDQFKWKNYNVLVFERYEDDEKKKSIYDKHIFYVRDDKSNTVFRVQTEFSPIAMELEKTKYMLCASKDGTHYNSGLGFNDNFDYEVLKSAAIKMMERHIK